MNEKQMISKFDFFYNSDKYNKKLQNKKDVKKLRMLILSIILAAPFSAYLGIYVGELISNHRIKKTKGSIYNEQQVAQIINETGLKAEQKILYLEKLNKKSKLSNKSILIEVPVGLISSNEMSCTIHIKNNDNKDTNKITGIGDNLQNACENAINKMTE